MHAVADRMPDGMPNGMPNGMPAVRSPAGQQQAAGRASDLSAVGGIGLLLELLWIIVGEDQPSNPPIGTQGDFRTNLGTVGPAGSLTFAAVLRHQNVILFRFFALVLSY